MNDSRPPKPKRRWYQFRLRTLLVATIGLGVVSGWVGSRVQKARNHRELYKAVSRLRDAALVKGVGSKPTDWLGRLLGDPGVLRVDFVSAYMNSAFDDADLENLEGLSVYVINLHGTQVTDAGLEHIATVTDLEQLSLGDTDITDAGLEQLERLTKLRNLYLDNTSITDAGLVHLERLANVRTLSLRGTGITDEGVKRLQQALPNCEIRH